MRQWLLPYLACPACGSDLQLLGEHPEEDVIEGTLVCTSCRQQYPVMRGVARFVAHHYAENFGLEWRLHRTTQLDTRSTPHSEQRFFAETGFQSERLQNKLVLDAGCGSGRFADVCAKYGSRVIAFDLSEAVDACQENLGRYPNIAVVQADMYHPPFKKHIFDFVYSLGVIQHTPAPLQAVTVLLDFPGPEGEIGFWFYARTWKTFLHPKYLLRPLLKRIPPQQLYRFVSWYVPKLLPVSRAIRAIPYVGKILCERLVPLANRDDVDGLSQQQKQEWSVLDTFDWFSPRYDNPQRLTEVKRAIDQGGYKTWITTPESVHGVRTN